MSNIEQKLEKLALYYELYWFRKFIGAEVAQLIRQEMLSE